MKKKVNAKKKKRNVEQQEEKPKPARLLTPLKLLTHGEYEQKLKGFREKVEKAWSLKALHEFNRRAHAINDQIKKDLEKQGSAEGATPLPHPALVLSREATSMINFLTEWSEQLVV